ncbi:MAG: sulfatase-like hydrolase/transferase [Muribaculaceae bacterium]|nr:sulfatase-like hydrolase/transferase [Muribaculaceae bacterium]
MRRLKYIKNKVMTSPLAPLVAVVCNLLIAYVIYFIARVAYYLENHTIFSQGLQGNALADAFAGGLVFDTSAIMYTCALYIIMMLLPLHLKERSTYHKVCKWVFVIINSIALAMNLMDAVYFQYTSRRTTSTVFSEFGNEGNLAGIMGIEFIKHWYFVLLAAVLIWLMWKLYVTPRLEANKCCNWRYYVTLVLSLVAMIPAVIGGMRGGLAHSVRPITVSNANQYVDRPIDAALVLNTPFSILRTLGKNVFADPHYFDDKAQLEAIYTPIHQPDSAAVFTPKNVVVIIVESLGKEYIGTFNRDLDGGKYQGYTPFIDSLLTRSLTFKYSYANGRKSIDAMPSVLSGIPMMIEPFLLTPASMNDLSGLAHQLDEKGYSTAFFHGANNGSMGFQAFARATGYQQYLGRDEYNQDPHFGGDKDYDGMWAIWDEPFLHFMLTKLNGYKEPFLATVFTASSHHPFKVPEQLEKQYPDEGGQPIHKCVRYTDMALRHFFENAAKQPWYDNTLFVIVADHTNQTTHDIYQTDLGLYSIPIIFFTPDGSLAPAMRDDVVMQQASIMPTIMGMLGYDKPYLAFGCDIVNTPADQTWAFNYSNGIYQYIKGDLMMQFDGEKTKAIYRFKTDPILRNNLAGKVPEQQTMERDLKALIQQYMDRMNGNRLTAGS